MKRFERIISTVVLICFIINTAVSDYALALSPQPGTVSEPGRLNAAALALFAEHHGASNIDFAGYISARTSAAKENIEWSYVPADYAGNVASLGEDPIF
jgi:hypothetical protein